VTFAAQNISRIVQWATIAQRAKLVDFRDDVCKSVGDGVTTGAEWMTSVALVLAIAKKMATVQYVFEYISKLRE
jgi:hypothetical protein